MTDAARVIAERVMGWHLPAADPELPVAWLDANDRWVGYWAERPPMVTDPDYDTPIVHHAWLFAGNEIFDPVHNIAHAMMALEKFGHYWTMNRLGDKVFCRIVFEYDKDKGIGRWTKGEGSTPSEAICTAILEAVKEKGAGLKPAKEGRNYYD